MRGRGRATRLTDAVARIAVTGADDRGLRERLLELIRGAVPFDAYAFLLTDPVTSVGCSPLAKVPNPAALPDLIRCKYLTPVNRWTELPVAGCASLQQTTGGRPDQSLLWREHLAGFGIHDVVSVVFRDRYGWWGFLDLWRRGSRFTEDEVAAMADARPGLTARLRGAQAAAFTAGDASAPVRGPGALILTPTLTIRAQTPQTQDWMRALLPPPSGGSPVPASAYNIAAQLLATEAGVDAHPAQARVHLGGGRWLTLRADRLNGPEPIADRDIVVTMETSSPAERRDVFCRSHGLTRRETEVLQHLAAGSDTRAVAHSMLIGELTVQDHLKAVFTKTHTSSRRELLAISGGR